MSQLDNIVKVEITRGSVSVSAASFGAALVLAKTTVFPGDVRNYESAQQMLDDGFADTDPAYLAARDYFRQTPRPRLIVVGRRAMTRIIGFTIANNFEYSVTIGGVEYTYTSDGDATESEIKTGLINAINVDTDEHGLTASNGGTNAVLLTPAAAQCPAIVLGNNLTLTDGTTTATIAQDLNRIQLASSEWYAVVLADRDDTDATAVANWVEDADAPHVFGYASADPEILNPDSPDDLAAVFKDTGYTRSFVFYHHLAASRYPDAAEFGKVLTLTPGSYTAAYKSLALMPTSALTDGQIAAAMSKNATVYITVAGADIVKEGKVAVGEYLDVIIFLDWLKARIAERVFALLASSAKVPFTDTGIAAIESQVRAVVQEGVDAGGLAADPAPTFQVPRAADVPTQDKQDRILRNVNFNATLAGAIHYVEVNGFVSV